MLLYIPDDCVSFAVAPDRFDCENPRTGHGRWQYRYVITVADVPVVDATDLHGPTTTAERPDPLAAMLDTLLDHFAAYAHDVTEERLTDRPGRHSDRFPAACRSLADALDPQRIAHWRATINGH